MGRVLECFICHKIFSNKLHGPFVNVKTCKCGKVFQNFSNYKVHWNNAHGGPLELPRNLPQRSMSMK